MNDNYSNFARYYDILTSNIDYPKRGAYFHEVISRYKTADNNILLDLACGTGSVSEVMAGLGYDVIGVDSSPEMLGIAMEKKYESGLPIQYLCQDMRKLDMYGTVGVTVCALDGLNHLPTVSDIQKVFNRVSLFTESGGVFIFDMNTEYKHKHVLSDNIFVYETDNVYCVWENSIDEKYTVSINLEFFERDGEAYYRTSESFCEYVYGCGEIREALKTAGFDDIFCFSEDSFDGLNENDERVIWVALKK